MKTFIVPTDFSETSKNAAMYAAQLAGAAQDVRIILYYEFHSFVAGSDSSPLAEETEARKKIAELALQNVKTEMQSAASADISYIASEGGSFIKGLSALVSREKADLVIMGITISDGLDQAIQTLTGTNSLQLVNENVCPVMIIPPQARFKKIEHVLFATDLKEIETSAPVNNIKAVIDLFSPTIHIVHVDTGDMPSDDVTAKEKNFPESMFAGYNHHFHVIRESDFQDAISRYVSEKNIQLIITIPRTHSFISSLFTRGHTKQLVYHSDIPVVAIHE